MEGVLKGRAPFADFDNFPADAQLGLLSMSWGMGSMFNFPKFQGFVEAGDWNSAAAECRFQPDTGTITTRNDRDQQLFGNAAAVIDQGLDPDALVCPARLRRSCCDPPYRQEKEAAVTAFDIDISSPFPAGFTGGLGAPNQGGHQPPNWYIQFGMTSVQMRARRSMLPSMPISPS